MAITKLNSLAIPAGTVEPADIGYPLTNFSSTGIDDNATSTAITIDASENVGIGTTSTSSIQGLLHIHSSSDDNGDGDGEVNFGDESTVIISTNATVAGGQGYYGSLFFGGQDINSATQQVWKLAGFSAYSAPDLGTTGSADLLFYTTSSSSTPTERMRISAGGNVGIGDTSPDAGLTVHNNAGAVIATSNIARQTYTSVGQLQVSTAGSGGILIHSGASSTGYLTFGDGATSGRILYNHTSDYMAFIQNGSERMRIGDGNVGIGTTTFDSLLSIGTNGSTERDAINIGTNYPSGGTKTGKITWRDATNIVGQIDTSYDGTAVRMNIGSLYSSGYNSDDIMRIDPRGITKPKNPAFFARHSNSTQGTGVIPYNSESYDIGSNFNTSNYRFVAPVAGYYFFEAFTLMKNSIGGDHRMQIRKNGARIHGSERIYHKPASTWWTLNCNTFVYLAANDYVEAYIPYIPNGGLIYGDTNYNGFFGFLVS